ncbi:MAG: hypothetical protein SOZ89_01855 [Peptoniphilaceae bacterium]|nr:hypothetical protein [Peptoniphilaceae bacterium]MDD7383755.1 hypothetical protein [Peptoniphilaceae bacterium]MDY3737846.1 hypothetical protein [Peptoniphilaceae bacterium]
MSRAVIFFKNLWRAIIYIVLFSAISYVCYLFLIPQTYVSESKVMGTSKPENVTEVASYKDLINTTSIKKQVIENLGLDMTVEEYNKKVEIQTDEDSAVVTIKAKDKNALKASDLADETADFAVKVINKEYKGKAKILEYGIGNEYAISNTNKSIILGALVGLVFGILDTLITTISDKSIYTIKNINEKYNVLGQIPRIDGVDLNEQK